MKRTILPTVLVSLALFFSAAGCSSGSSTGQPQSGVSSGTTAQEATATYRDEVVVHVPAGAAATPEPVAIQPVLDPPSYEFSGVQALAAYEISMENATTFTQPLEIRLKVDATKLRKDVPAADQLIVAYYDESAQRWTDSDFTYDEANSTVVISTDHLSFWGLFGLDDGEVETTSPHFRIYFNEELNAPLLSAKPTGAGSIYDFAVEVRKALEEAYTRYADAGFKMPERSNVYIDDWGPEKTAEWGWFNKSIEIPVTYSDLSELKQDVAHELFHAIQNQYVRAPSMMASRWWMEATADYAAAGIGTNNGLQTVMGLDFIKKPLTDSDSRHIYRVAHFIDYLVKNRVDFKSLFEASLMGWGGPVAGIEKYLREPGLGQYYADFARAFVFSDELKREPLPNNSPIDLADYKETYKKADAEKGTLVQVPQGYAAQLVAYEITDDESEPEYKAYLFANNLSDSARVTYRIVEKSGFEETGTLTSVNSYRGFAPKKGARIYFLVTSGSDSMATLAVGITQKRQGGTGQTYSHSFESKIYNEHYLADVTLDLESSVPFVVESATVVYNNSLLYVVLKIPDLSNGATISATAAVQNVRTNREKLPNSNLAASLGKVEWNVSSGQGKHAKVAGSMAEVSLPPESADRATMDCTVFVNTVNTTIENDEPHPDGSGTVISILIHP